MFAQALYYTRSSVILLLLILGHTSLSLGNPVRIHVITSSDLITEKHTVVCKNLRPPFY